MADLELLRARAKAKLKLREQNKQEGPSVLETIGREGAQGASLGFSDEAAGVGSAISEAIHGEGPISERLKAGYKSGREDERRNMAEDEKFNPGTTLASKIAGGGLPAVATGGAGVTTMGALQGLGSSGADLTEGDIAGAAKDTAIGGVSAKALETLFKIAPALAKKLGARAGQMAEKATGATRVQAEKFQPGTGTRLLEEGYIKPFSSPKGLAERLQEGMKTAGGNIDEAITGMDKSGQIVDKEAVISRITNKMKELERDPSQAPIIKKLQGYIDDIRGTPANVESIAGDVEGFTPSLAENTKRGYQGLANYTDPEKTQAVKHAAGAFKEEVEGAASRASPEIAEKFAKGKSDWGFLAPVEEAASSRAAQLNQSPVGGFLDVTSTVAGEAARGGMGIPAAVARRVGAPRLPQTMAYGMHKGSKALGAEVPPVIQNILSRLPQTAKGQDVPNQDIPIHRMGKYAGPLAKAKERGPQALAATSYILGQSDPEYRELLKQEGETDGRY